MKGKQKYLASFPVILTRTHIYCEEKILVGLLCYRDLLCITKLGHKSGKRYESPCRFTRSNYVSESKKKQKHGPCTNAHHSGVLGTVPRVGVYL